MLHHVNCSFMLISNIYASGVKGTHTKSNNTFEMEKTLGIEAARLVL